MALPQSITQAALEQCAREPVHTPGIIQPIGALLAFDRTSRAITHVSANIAEYLGNTAKPSVLLGADIKRALGTEIHHDVAQVSTPEQRRFVAVCDLAGRRSDIHAFLSGESVVLELELTAPEEPQARDILQEVSQLFDSFDATRHETDLLQKAVDTLRFVTGYDRVMAYRFDDAFNGSVVAESVVLSQEPMLGRHFPNSDIPPQARDIMKRAPLRLISDCDQTPIQLIAASAELAPLDIALAHTRGVSPIHIEYLRNMGSQATMTLSIVVDGALWGLLSFHHQSPRVPSMHVRQLCSTVLHMLQNKLALILRDDALRVARMLQDLSAQALSTTLGDFSVAETLSKIAPDILRALQASGMTVMMDDTVHGVGRQIGLKTLRQLAARALKSKDNTFATDMLDPTLNSDVDRAVAGICVTALDANNCFSVQRAELARSITWAGPPDKSIDTSAGAPHLSPRRSFAAYIEDVTGHSAVWTANDLHITRTLGTTLLAALEKRETSRRLARQQGLMVRELDHRVKNIMSLIQSISRAARRENASKEDYGTALEMRIKALSAAHDIGLRGMKDADAVSMHKLLRIQAAPYATSGDGLSITGPDCLLQGEFAPIVALVLHELMTNAAKYGALSTLQGRIEVALKRETGGIAILWQESGLEDLQAPKADGFGTTLIRDAIPYELGGRAELDFLDSGIEAQFWLPPTVVDLESPPDTMREDRTTGPVTPAIADISIPSMLLVEDNFMIAADLAVDLRQMGVGDVDTVSNVTDALEFLDRHEPSAALLDINLGSHRQTSTAIAARLKENGVPFVVMTGYSAGNDLPAQFNAYPVLRKPISPKTLAEALSWIASQLPVSRAY